ncbi:MAG: hypothetical protein ACREBG_23155 [Pyrinomonadaceae bacterium]
MSFTFVNDAVGSGDASSTTIAAAAANHTGGNHLIVWVAHGSGTITVSSIADTAGNTYAQVPSALRQVASFGSVDIWRATNITGNASNVVTVTFSATTSFRRIVVHQFSATNSGSMTNDTASTGTGTGTAMSCTSFTPANANELIIAGYSTASGTTFTAGTNFTLQTSPNTDSRTERWIQTTATATTGAMTETGNQQWVGDQAAFIEPAAAGGGTINPTMLALCGVGQ